jgi:hypothetical protein
VRKTAARQGLVKVTGSCGHSLLEAGQLALFRR